jgi:formylglycine-generating enzyme required for sulfatase activity
MAEKERDLTAESSPSQPSKYQPRYNSSYAIVVGIDTYNDPKLRPLGKAEEDAQRIHDVLSAKPYNFQVELLLGAQATKRAITRALKKISDSTQLDDRVIFYFAGHGYITQNNRGVDIGYLACADTDPTDPFDGLKYDNVIELTQFAKAKHIAFILDACFSGSALGLTRAVMQTAAVEEYLLHTAYQVLSAGAVEVVSDTRSMTGELVKTLQAGIPGQTAPFTFSHLGQHIHDIVHNQSKGRQSPVCGFLEGSSKGQMVLVTPSLFDSLPEKLRQGLTNPNADMRYFAIAEAEKYLAHPDLGETVRLVLEEMQTEDDDRDVRRRVKEALRNAPEVDEHQPKPITSESAGKLTEPEEIKPEAPAIKPPEKKTKVVPEPGEIKSEPPAIKPSEKKTEVIPGQAESKPEPRKEVEPKLPVRDPIPDILPPPFEWCNIPAGRVTLERNAGTFEVKPFKMAKYPITYAQFQVFVDASDGYKNDLWWQNMERKKKLKSFEEEEEEKRKRRLENISDPSRRAYLEHERFFTISYNTPYEQGKKIGNHPREAVDWADAVAFCRWLSKRVSYEIRLPTEWEWQWAAQGPDCRKFPWGDTPQQGYANFSYGLLGFLKNWNTTPVDKFPKGTSYYGVMDMVGNVSEWCLNEYDSPDRLDISGDAKRTSRGGSWASDAEEANCVFRCANDSENSSFTVGFRVCSPI